MIELFRKKTYMELIIPTELQHPINHEIVALNLFWYRAIKYLEDSGSQESEVERIKQIATNDCYKPSLIDK